MNLRTISLIALLAILLFVSAKVLADVKSERIKIKVSGACIEQVEEVAGAVDGVIQSHWDEETGELEIVFEQDKTSLNEIEQTISEAGFDTPNYKASEEDVKRVSTECKEKETAGEWPDFTKQTATGT
jgi:periplasmic mercuric ion binding protein